MKKEDEKLVKASLIAGLKLFGIPREGFYHEKEMKRYIKKFNIDVSDFRYKCGSGLMWIWDDTSTIEHKLISERIREQSEGVGLEDIDECIDNTQIDDWEYVFWPDGTGFTGYMDEERKKYSDEGIFQKFLRWKDGKLYTFWADGIISVYTMDIDDLEECKLFIKKLMKEKGE